MEIRKSAIEPIIDAIKRLDELVVINVAFDKDGKEQKTAKRIILSGKTTTEIARALKLLKAEQEIISDTRQKLFNQRESPESPGTLTGKAALEFQREHQKVLAEKVDIQITQVQLKDFNLDEKDGNKIPIDVLENLLDVIIAPEGAS